MIANHIHDALLQVRKLQELVLEKTTFRGYSGTARIVSGILVLAASGVMSLQVYPSKPQAHLIGWGVVLGLCLVINYAALLYWFLFDRNVLRNPTALRPALDAVPALLVGGVLSVAIVVSHTFHLLFGAWMCLYGLGQTAYRRSLPGGIFVLGLCYILFGAYCLLSPQIEFTEPWPMGVVFLCGECAGGWILIRDKRRRVLT